jgi:signal transduction histidine kinase
MTQRRPFSSDIKLVLFFFALAIVVGIMIYTQSIVEKLKVREHRMADLVAKAYQTIGKPTSSDGDYTFIFDEVINQIDLPIILTDAEMNPIGSRNVMLDSTLTDAQRQEALCRERDRIATFNPPIAIYTDSVTISQYVFYDQSPMIGELRFLPVVEILLAGLFVLFGYAGFSYIKRNEQANIWVGMSRETAHQLGTPLSSLLGWIELLRAQTDDPLVHNTVAEMEQDVNKLNRIANRFSKIGSQPDLTRQDITVTIAKVTEYLRIRAPRLGKRVEIIFNHQGPLTVPFNTELFEWVLENLIKNALDAIDRPEGRIMVTLGSTTRTVIIDVNDNGKGIESRRRKDVFRPGFSTKKRGWGLGLSLSKRIIENYHGGRLQLLESSPGKGSTFRIRLPLGKAGA